MASSVSDLVDSRECVSTVGGAKPSRITGRVLRTADGTRTSPTPRSRRKGVLVRLTDPIRFTLGPGHSFCAETFPHSGSRSSYKGLLPVPRGSHGPFPSPDRPRWDGPAANGQHQRVAVLRTHGSDTKDPPPLRTRGSVQRLCASLRRNSSWKRGVASAEMPLPLLWPGSYSVRRSMRRDHSLQPRPGLRLNVLRDMDPGKNQRIPRWEKTLGTAGRQAATPVFPSLAMQVPPDGCVDRCLPAIREETRSPGNSVWHENRIAARDRFRRSPGWGFTRRDQKVPEERKEPVRWKKRLPGPLNQRNTTERFGSRGLVVCLENEKNRGRPTSHWM